METLSVIIPVYNCREYLESCIASITAVNECADKALIHEIILVDDGSTDGSSELCDKSAETVSSEDCKIRVIHQANRGVSAARNAGLLSANGTFIFFVDSDDTVDSRKLADLIQMIGQNTSVDLAVFGMAFDYYAGNRIYRQDLAIPPIQGIKQLAECTTILYDLFQKNMISSLCNKLIRKSVIEDAGISLREDMFLYEDLEFSLRVLAQCSTICFRPEPIYHYRQTSDEGGAGRRLKRIAHIPEIVDKIEEALDPFDDTDRILLSLYLTLARVKIRCATKTETDVICSDFKGWIDRHGWKDKIAGKKWATYLYNGSTYRLLFQREKSKIRHSTANRIKRSIGDFRKWKSRS